MYDIILMILKDGQILESESKIGNSFAIASSFENNAERDLIINILIEGNQNHTDGEELYYIYLKQRKMFA